MHLVVYKSQSRPALKITDEVFKKIDLANKTGMLNARQKKWFDTVSEIVPYRKLNNHRIHQTKDLFDGDCNECQKAAEVRSSHWDEGIL